MFLLIVNKFFQEKRFQRKKKTVYTTKIVISKEYNVNLAVM